MEIENNFLKIEQKRNGFTVSFNGKSYSIVDLHAVAIPEGLYHTQEIKAFIMASNMVSKSYDDMGGRYEALEVETEKIFRGKTFGELIEQIIIQSHESDEDSEAF